ncbi:MAG: hypothetical protein KGQ28_07755 [Hyphomicrobiales bacterium]|nr:hypothetical protein [Hyphomicrobiales bacterium]
MNPEGRPRRVVRTEALEPLSLRPRPAVESARTLWRRRYALFLRIVGLIWLVKGVGQWAIVVGADPRAAAFAALPTDLKATTAFFACIDPLAGLGLWLVSAWGGALWIAAAGIEIALALSAYGGPAGIAVALLDAILIAAYLALSWIAAAEADGTLPAVLTVKKKPQ